ncbi:MAG TPA: UDP-glucose 4-epimerase GalE [Bacteroidia bacterium]|jgi:UDP-glucose 4-epimerase|nr:UDP-glucose 4-epimerase GalE [Bacteroidia bacterium]
MSKKTVLVTGGAGYIGSHTIIELLNHGGYEVISADNFSNSSPKAYNQIKLITGKSFKTYKLDLCDIHEFDKIFSENKIDGIIHFAAFKAVGESVELPLKYYHNNIASLVNLLELCRKHKTSNVIFSSSCSVYGNVEKMPVNESTPLPKAESPYAYTKQIGEAMIEDVCKRYLDFNAVSLRYFNPVGSHISGKIGEWPINKPNNLVPLITGTAIGKYPQLTVFGGDYSTRDGTNIRDYIHVSDIANAHVLALDYLILKKNKINYDVFNLGSGNGVSVLEAIAAFEKISGKKLNYKIGERRPGDVISVYSDSRKVEKAFGWKCAHDINSMMKTAWDWELYRQAEKF